MISADILLDRIKLKKHLKLWQFITFIAIFIIIFLFTSKNFDHKTPFIARIEVSDIILQDFERSEILKKIENNKLIRGVILHINSPGGTSYGGEILYRDLRKIAEKKPLVAVLETLAASAGYMTAIAADYIISGHTTLTGSVGVLLQTAEATELASKIGIKFETYKSGDLKAVPSPLEQTSDNAKKVLHETIMDSYDFFINLVKTRRNLTDDIVKIISDGRVLTGNQALKLGLVDKIGTEEDAIKWLKEKQIDFRVHEVVIKPKRKIWEEILDKSQIRSLFKLAGLQSIWHSITN